MDAGRFPTFFSLCKAVDSQLYLRTIVDELRTPLVVPRVYDRFITEICAVRPALIITTNADPCLEQHSNLPTALYQDIEQVMRDTYPGGCILKLHGCTSVTNSLIFTEEDYQRLINQPGLLASLEQLFSSRTAIFIG
jgi:SIR2-like domain